MPSNYLGTDFVTPFDPSGYATITPTQLAQLVGGVGPITNAGGFSIGLFLKTYDVAGVPTVPNPTTYSKLAGYGWLRMGALNATLYIWNDNGASDDTLLQWQIANINSINGIITGSQIAH